MGYVYGLVAQNMSSTTWPGKSIWLLITPVGSWSGPARSRLPNLRIFPLTSGRYQMINSLHSSSLRGLGYSTAY